MIEWALAVGSVLGMGGVVGGIAGYDISDGENTLKYIATGAIIGFFWPITVPLILAVSRSV